MKLKYYLRGLGIGIIVTALLMGYSNHTHTAVTAVAEEETSEAETTAAMSGVLADRNGTATEEAVSETETVTTEPVIIRDEQPVAAETTEPVTEEPGSEATGTEEAETEAESTAEELTTQEEASTEPVQEETEATASTQESQESETSATEPVSADGNTAGTVTLMIVSGDDSGTVARKVQTAGLISDASEFDAYLMQHGYDKKITTGTVEIPVGSTWLEIAELLAGRH